MQKPGHLNIQHGTYGECYRGVRSAHMFMSKDTCVDAQLHHGKKQRGWVGRSYFFNRT